MNKLKVFFALGLTGLLLGACGAQPSVDGNLQPVSEVQSDASQSQVQNTNSSWPIGQAREDGQGSVTVKVTMEQINSSTDTIEFVISMDTHSVELNMDLAELSTLTTNTGLSVDGATWDAPREGHHVEGTLSFPASVNGVTLLDGATQVTLIIRNVDAAERSFSWQAGT